MTDNPVLDAIDNARPAGISANDPFSGYRALDERVAAMTATFRAAKNADARELLPIFDASDLAGLDVPPRRWHVPGLIPAETVTSIYGDGGIGKSLLALQLGCSTARGGKPWIGRETAGGRCLFVTAEDTRDELHRRLADIAAEEAFDLADLDALSISSLAGKDAVLAAPGGRSGLLRETRLYHALETQIADAKPVLAIIDPLADFFGGDEIIKSQARQFIAMLRHFCVVYETTVLLAAHPSLSGMSSGSGTSGNTAWNNSVRSRLYFERVKSEDGREIDPDARVLRTVKSNYGRVGEEIRLRWRNGVFIVDAGSASYTTVASQARAERIFLDLLAAYLDEGRNVSSSPSSSFAPTVFAKDPRAESLGKSVLTDAMNRLFAARRIRNEEIGRASKRTTRVVLVDLERGGE